MIVNIAASHRFHLLDLARELENNGHTVRFYSYVPKKRCITFGLSSKASKSFFYLFLPLLIIDKLNNHKGWTRRLLFCSIDFYLSLVMPRCDVFIGLGTVYLKTFKKMQSKYNARTILEWGSKHITANQEIIKSISGRNEESLNRYFISRSMMGYSIADYIAIPSNHVRQSFIDNSIEPSKLIQNAYGVDLTMFYRIDSHETRTFDLIFVGAWSYRKGCDIVIDFLKKYPSINCIHVGSIVDIEFPSMKNLHHIDSVDQSKLVNYYSKAKVFILPSREEGLAMVQAQALACGLPIVCTNDTGGEDLGILSCANEYIYVIDQINIEGFESKVFQALREKLWMNRIAYNDINLQNLSWLSYGKRYTENLRKIQNFASND